MDGTGVPATVATALDTVDAQKVAASVRGALELTPQANAILTEFYEQCVAQTKMLCTAEEVLKAMEGYIDPSGINQLNLHCSGPIPVFRPADLQRILGYAIFSQHVLCVPAPLQLEVRVEAWKAYALATPEATLLGGCSDKSLAYVHGPTWAADRFQNEGGPDFGLCGQWEGKSKFVAPYFDRSLMPRSKEEALLAFGLKGYDMFDHPGKPLYLVHIKLNEAILQQARPAVPLVTILEKQMTQKHQLQKDGSLRSIFKRARSPASHPDSRLSW